MKAKRLRGIVLPVLGLVGLVSAVAVADVRTFTIDTAGRGAVLPNTSQMLTAWAVPKVRAPQSVRNGEWDVRDFVEWVEIMAATGGNASRDCYRDPQNRAVTDDYDFSALVEGCRGIVALGMKPYLKLGNVPMKLSTNIANGGFMMNVRPPDDYAEYVRYMEACARALLAAFGKEELLKWRFAVLTEYENAGWFQDASGDAERTFQAYCLLYEKTVETFARVVSPDLTFGAHAMAVTEGLWDERRFFAFVAVRRLPLKFVTASFYDMRPGAFTHGLPLPKAIAHLRAGAEKAGLKNLFYGVDEGRVLEGVSGGKLSRNLATRIVGDTYQAAYDARVVRQLFDSGADYLAAWGYLSGPDPWYDGIPSVSFHVARESAKFKGMRRLSVVAEGGNRPDLETEAVAAIAENGRRIQIMAYSFTNDLHAAGTVRVRCALKCPAAWLGKDLSLTRRIVDDRVNWFPQWRRDRKEMGLSDDRFRWSPDDPAVLGGMGLIDAADRVKFQETLLPRYQARARLEAQTRTVTPKDGKPFAFEEEMQVNSAIFLELQLR